MLKFEVTCNVTEAAYLYDAICFLSLMFAFRSIDAVACTHVRRHGFANLVAYVSLMSNIKFPQTLECPPPECARLIFGVPNGIGSCWSKNGCYIVMNWCMSGRCSPFGHIWSRSPFSSFSACLPPLSDRALALIPSPISQPCFPSSFPLRASCIPSHLFPPLCLPAPATSPFAHRFLRGPPTLSKVSPRSEKR